MFSNSIQIIAIALLVLYPLYAIVKNGLDASRILFCVGLWTAALLCLMDMLVVQGIVTMPLYKRIALPAESLMPPIWIAFSHVYCREEKFAAIPTIQRLLFVLSFIPLGIVLYFPAADFFYSPDFAMDQTLFLEPLAFFFYLQIILFLAVALFNFEATIANAPHGVKWKIKIAMIGTGAIIAVFALYFAQSIIFRAIDMGFITVRAFCIVIGLLMVIYSETFRGSGERIVISRQLAYRSFVIFFSGLFLFLVGVVGEGVKIFGDHFNTYLFDLVLFLGGLALIVVFMSEGVRRKLRLMIQKNFYGEKYDYRIEWKNVTECVTASRSRDELYKNILTVYCETFGIVGGCIMLQGRHSKDFTPALFHEVDPAKVVIPASAPIVRQLEQQTIINLKKSSPELDDALRDFFTDADIHFLVALVSGGAMQGIILLGPPINLVEPYDEEDLELMEAIARHASAVIMNMRLGDELAEARDMEGFGKVAAFVLHDLKNQVYPLSLLVENARQYINDREFQVDMLDSLTNVANNMKGLISQLTNLPRANSLHLERVDLMRLARKTAESMAGAEIEFIGEGVEADIDVEQFSKVLLNLYVNALEAGESNRFQVHVGRDGARPCLKVVDFGPGIDEKMLQEGLFLPFKSTKEKGMGIGLFQCKQIIAAHRGTILVNNLPEGGAEFVITLPERTDNTRG